MKRIAVWVLIAGFATLACREKVAEEIQQSLQKQPAEETEDYQPKLPTRIVFIDTFKITVEVAEKPEDRGRGLMYRTYLPDTIGMLFIFEVEAPHSFWMKNTLIPLSIAFIDKELIITDIKWMKPGDLSSHAPSRPILYALETNRGWFTQRGIKPGAKIRFSE